MITTTNLDNDQSTQIVKFLYILRLPGVLDKNNYYSVKSFSEATLVGKFARLQLFAAKYLHCSQSITFRSFIIAFLYSLVQIDTFLTK